MGYGYTAHAERLASIRAGRRFCLLAGTAVAVVFTSVGSQAQTASTPEISQQQRRAYNIPAQPLAAAVGAFGRQSGLQVTLAAANAGSARTNAITGSFTAAEALSRLLTGTGIPYRFAGNGGSVVIGTVQASSASGSTDAGSTVLETIVVSGKADRNAASGSGYQGTPDWVYETPASVSVVSQDAIRRNPATRGVADTLDVVSGVQTNRSESQLPGVQVSVRGLQDMGRVTTMIDGARQNFQRSGHGGYQQTFVDQAFLRGIEIEKISGKGVGGAGSLGGSVNFRTVQAGDLIQEGRRTGAEVDVRSGTNKYNFIGSAIGAAELTDSFSVLAGISTKNIGDYDVGRRGDLPIPTGSQTVRNSSVIFSRTQAVNTLLKAEWDVTEDLNLQGSWLRFDGEGSTGGYESWIRNNEQAYQNDTLTLAATYDPSSPLVDSKGLIWFNKTTNDETRDNGGGRYEDYVYEIKSFGVSLENTSRFVTPLGNLSVNYGAEAYKDDGNTKSLTPPAIGQAFDGSWGLRGANPPGQRWMASAFSSATLEHDDWLTLTGGLRYDYYKLQGSTLVQDTRPVVTPEGPCQEWADLNEDGTPDPSGVWYTHSGNMNDAPVWYSAPGPGREFMEPSCWKRTPASTEWVYDAVPVDVNKSGGAWLPSATIAVKPFDWLQPFVSYSQSYRPPAVFEALLSGGHPNSPFDNAPNPYIRPERGETWEFGANISHETLFTADDAIRAKVVYFRRSIEDYITLGNTFYGPLNTTALTSVNLDGETKVDGFEVEASYDAGYAYIGGSYTRTETEWANSFTSILRDGGSPETGKPQPTVLFLPPKLRVTVDAGVRLFEEKLVLGARLNHVSETLTGGGALGGYLNPSYTTYDLYGSYDLTPQAKLRFGVTNLTDELYIPSLANASYPAAGRTYTASLKLKF